MGEGLHVQENGLRNTVWEHQNQIPGNENVLDLGHLACFIHVTEMLLQWQVKSSSKLVKYSSDWGFTVSYISAFIFCHRQLMRQYSQL